MVRGLDKLFRTALIIIPIGVVGNVVFSLLFTNRALLAALTSFDRAYLLLALGLGVIPWFTNSLRLLIWTRFLEHQISFFDAFRITLATDLGAAVSPAAVGGNFFKWGLLVQRGVSPGAAASVTTLTPLEDGVFFALAIPLALLYTASWGNPVFASASERFGGSAAGFGLGAFAFLLILWALMVWVLRGGVGTRAQRRSRKLLTRLRRSARATWTDARQVFRLIGKRGKKRFALSLSLTGVQWIARYSIVTVLFAFLGVPVQPVLFFLLQWVVFTLASFLPTPGGAGGAEAAFFVLYSPFVPANAISLATAAWRFFTFYLLLALAAIIYVTLGRWARYRAGAALRNESSAAV
jgi:uncharacterized protein (TIRG00374 family)